MDNLLQFLVERSNFSLVLFDDDDDDELAMEIIELDDVRRRGRQLYRRRWDSDYLVTLALNEGSFKNEYHVTPEMFDLLITVLSPALERNHEMQRRALSVSGSLPISSASKIGAMLIYLAGGRAMEAMRTHGMAKATFWQCFYEVVYAVNATSAFEIICDNSEMELEQRAEEFRVKCFNQDLFPFCTATIDGVALAIHTPRKSEVVNQRRTFSGHKKKHCINVQLVSDANCKILAVSAMHVGSTNDGEAFESCSQWLCLPERS
jgi:hypothetical protein